MNTIADRTKDKSSRQNKPSTRKKERTKSFFGAGFWTSLVIVILISTFLLLVLSTRPQVSGKELNYTRFVELAENGRIESARILDADSYVVGRYRTSGGATADFNLPYLKTADSRLNLLELLLENDIQAPIDQQFAKSLVQPGYYVLPALIMVTIFVYLVLSYRRSTGLFSVRSGARKFESNERRETFAEVAGQAEAVAAMRELAAALSDPQRFDEIGARLPRGLLLYGAPGCGKTLLARAFAGEIGASFFSISGSDFVELYYGVGAARVRDLFREAREEAPSVIFIDEIDAVGRSRGTGAGGEQEQALNQILTEMDGFSQSEGVIVLAATNRPDVLDPALLRPGRFDRSVGLERPGEADRLEILKVHARSRVLDPSVDLPKIAKRAYGMTGADLANVVNEAALLAGGAGKSAISQAELEEALDRVLQAPERQRRLALRQRSIGKRAEGLDERVTFAQLAGVDDAIQELAEVKDFLVEPERYADVGAVIPRGILLYGPPGCGKSLLARAMAGEAHGAFFSVSATEFVGDDIGSGAARVRDLFAEAKAVAPAIVFIDELDAVGGRRGVGTSGEGAADSALRDQEQTFTQILVELDGFEPRTGVIVMAATNRPDMLDPALLRPGRFDRQIGISLPDRDGRRKILELHARSRHLDASVDLDAIAERAHGMAGADLASVVNEAALMAVRAHKKTLSQADFEAAVRRLLEVPERQRRLSLRHRSVGRRATGIDERVTFADVAGVDDALEELTEVRDFLVEPERFAAMGVHMPRGILLDGPPGCGKTMLAKAVAGEANAAFLSVSGTDFVQRWVGLGAARVRDLFAEARAVAPAIVFIDELDALGGQRGDAEADSGRREQEHTLNQLLVELDGFEPREGVIVMAATNRPDMLDDALLRPGRFDRQIGISAPDRDGRKAILKLYASDKRMADDVDLDVVASLTPGFSGADLANLVNEAGLLATRKRLPEISAAVMDEAIERVLIGVSSRQHIMTEEERRITAYHEAGHALVALSLSGVSIPHKVTVVPRGRLGGYVWMVEEDDRTIHSRSVLINQMAVGFGGRAAEELVIGEPGSGAADDLAKASSLARKMVRELGMSEALGGVSYRDQPHGASGGEAYSAEENRLIGQEVRRLVDEAHKLALQVLSDSRPTLDKVATTLLERETLSGEELKALIRPAAPLTTA
ncbi:MAG: ATP-dependent metallopeptidase FtsH/Yme1/Tma family protein [Solirubrobacterales bacterium]